MTLRNKKAGCGGHQQPAGIQQQQEYHRTHLHVNRPRQIFGPHRDRRPAQAPSPAPRPGTSADAAALALLVCALALQAGGLHPKQRSAAWQHVSRRAGQIIDARRRQEAA
jgi:hypothetical protein